MGIRLTRDEWKLIRVCLDDARPEPTDVELAILSDEEHDHLECRVDGKPVWYARIDRDWLDIFAYRCGGRGGKLRVRDAHGQVCMTIHIDKTGD